MPVLESRLVIKAVDETGKVFAEIEKKIASLEKAAMAVDKVMSSLSRASTAAGAFSVDEMDAAIARMERLVKVTEEAAAAQGRLAHSARGAASAVAAGGGGSGAGAAGARGATRGHPAGRGGGHGGHGLTLMPSIGPLAGITAAIETYEVGKKIVENAADLQQLRFRIRELSRNDPSEAPLADRLAAGVSAKYPGITTSKALDTYIELRANSVDGKGRVDPAVAERNLMAGARAQNAALALGIGWEPSDMQNLLKGVEGSGRANDPKAVEKITDAYIRAKQVFGSAIATSMIRDYTANAKAANFSIGDDQYYRANMVRMSEGNASRLGNEVNQTLATLVGGHMTKGTGAWLVAHGLARPDQIRKTGPASVMIEGGVKDVDLLSTDQQAWAATTLKKSIEDSGAISDDKVAARSKMLRDQELKRHPNADIDERFLKERAEEGLISAEIAKMGVRTSVADHLAHFVGNERLISRDIQAMESASGLEAGDRLGQNPVAAFNELSSSISNFASVLASPLIGSASQAMDSLAHGIASITSALTGNKSLLNNYPAHISDDWAATGDWRTRAAYGHQADTHPMMWGERDMEGARGLAMSHLGDEHGPVQVDATVHGDATIKVDVSVTPTSELINAIAQARQAAQTMALNPVSTGHSGRMDSDAAPLGHGGIGHH